MLPEFSGILRIFNSLLGPAVGGGVFFQVALVEAAVVALIAARLVPLRKILLLAVDMPTPRMWPKEIF